MTNAIIGCLAERYRNTSYICATDDCQMLGGTDCVYSTEGKHINRQYTSDGHSKSGIHVRRLV